MLSLQPSFWASAWTPIAFSFVDSAGKPSFGMDEKANCVKLKNCSPVICHSGAWSKGLMLDSMMDVVYKC